MSRPSWKPRINSSTYARYFLCRFGSGRDYVEMHFLSKHFYYLILDPTKRAVLNAFFRRSRITTSLVGEFIRVFRGMRWRSLYVTSWHVGFCLGEFAKTRVRATFKSKTLTKKKKKKKSPEAAFLDELRISKLKLVKSGRVRKQRRSSVVGGGGYQFVAF